MLHVILIVVVILIVGLLAYAATKPNQFRVQRSILIRVKPGVVFAEINDLSRWQAWSPWEKLDPTMQRKASGPASGTGAVYEWAGNKQVGQGRMEIIESTPPSRIVLKLNFMRPFKAQNTVEFTLTPQGDDTEVTWAMYGPQPYMMKVMGTLMNCDKMVGRQYEEGLEPQGCGGEVSLTSSGTYPG